MKPEILIPIIVGAVLIVCIILFVILKKKKSNSTYSENITKIIDCLGGNDNIVSVTPKMSRVEFVLKDYEVVNKDTLKEFGVQGISKTSQKITLVVGAELAKDLEKTFKRS